MQADSTNPMIKSGLRPLACEGEGPRGWWWWDSHSTSKNIPRWVFTHNSLTSPGRPHLEWTESSEFGGLRAVLDHLPLWMGSRRLGWCIKYYFCTQKYRLQTKCSPFTPENAAAASSNYSKAGPGDRMAVRAAKALDSEEAAQKSWFHAGVENGLLRGKPWWLPMIGGHRSMA
jgi:hypothetical protein